MNKLQAMRRYQIAKVYRRDQPAMNRGKYREFYQCDFDIAGATDTMIAEAECVSMMAEILSALDIGGFCIKLNHRKLLDGIFAVCGVPEEKFRPICSAVDKLDKSPWEEVRKEMVEQKGLDGAVADRIWEFVSMKEVEPEALLARLKAGQLAGLDASAKALEELGTLFEYLAAYGVRPPVVSFDLSLARGLDYYTGLIYEAVRTSGELGSVAGGGRYDELVGIFSSRQVPCVGFSVGIERLFAILEENAKRKGNLRPYSTQVMVVSMGGKENLVPARLGLLRQLWDAGIAAEHLAKAHNKPKPQLDYASHHGIPLAVIVGASEMERSVVSIKDLRTGQQTNDVPRADMAATVNAMLGGASPAAASATPTPASGASAASAPSPAAQAPAPAADTPPAAEKPAEGAAAADAKGKKGKQKGVKAGAAAVPRPEYCDHRIAMFERIKAENEAAAAAKAAEGKPIKVTLPDGAVKEGVAFKTSPMDIAFGISKGLANRVLVAKVNGNIWDLCRPMEEDSALELCDFETPEGKHTFWHSTAHMMGEALELQWGVNLCIGPCNGTDQGFFYDSFMGDRVISEEDYKTVEQGVQKVANAKQKFERVVITVEQALEIFRHNKFKCELISKFADAGTTMTAYRCGDLVDLCRGPHVPNTSVVKAMMVTNHGQAYWLADAKNASLQRVYGVSFPDKKQLAEYQHFLAEAKKRDHRLLGVKQELFFFDQLSPGSAFFLPLGARIYNTLMELMRQEYRKRGFEEVLTPNVYNMKLWETSGHAANYKENMFLFDVEGQCFGLKPMNCPGHCLMFKHRVRSWRELPLRLADFGVLHRNEMSGALTGLTRVRRFQQDDAHIFCMPDQVEAEIEGALDFLRHTYQIFGFEFHLLLSTRPEKYIGEIETWNTAEKSLENALNASGLKWELNEGDGAFYGPKIDIQVSDALRRKHQCATIQLDFQLPIRFGLEFAAPEGAGSEARTARPVMIHRAILGSVERMISILTEHFGGKWPFWLSPRQAIVIPVAVELIPQATEIKERLHAAGIYAEVDDSHKQLPKKVREAQLEQWNYLLVVGPEEVRTGTVAVRSRQEHEKDRDVERGNWDVNDLVAEFVRLRDTRVREVIATRPTLRPEAPAAEEAKEAKPEGQ